jgi:hypothetical protein
MDNQKQPRATAGQQRNNQGASEDNRRATIKQPRATTNSQNQPSPKK